MEVTCREIRDSIWKHSYHPGLPRLSVLAYLQGTDIAHIECRHAQLRRVLRKSQTHIPDVGLAAADMTLLRERDRCLYRTAANQREKRTRSKKAYTRGGGKQRAALSRFLTGRTYKTRAERSQAFREANQQHHMMQVAGGEALGELQREGRAATISARAGGEAFGLHRRPRQGSAHHAATSALARCLNLPTNNTNQLVDKVRTAAGAAANAFEAPAVVAAANRGDGAHTAAGAAVAGAAGNAGEAPVVVAAAANGGAGAQAAAVDAGIEVEAVAAAANLGAATIHTGNNALASARPSSTTPTSLAFRHLWVSKCEDALVAVQSKHKKRRREVAEGLALCQDHIRKWQRTHADDIPDTYCNTPISGLQGRRCPSGLEKLDFVCFEPPLAKMAEQMLSGRPQNDEVLAEALKTMRAAWFEKTKPFMSKDTEKLPRVSPPRVAACFYAGICMCTTEDGRSSLRAVASLCEKLRSWLAPDGRARAVYDLGKLVLKLSIANATPPGDEKWVHIGYGNLNTWHFSCLELRRAEGARSRAAAALNLVALDLHQCPDSCENWHPHNFWEIMEYVKQSTTAGVEAFEVHSNKEMHYRLIPGLQVLAKAFLPALEDEFSWERPEQLRPEGPGEPHQDLPEMLPLADAGGESENTEQDEQSSEMLSGDSAGNEEGEAQHNKEPAESSGEDIDSTGARARPRRKVRVVGVWESSDDDGASGAELAGGGADEDHPPPPVPELVPPADSAPPMPEFEGALGGPRRDRRAPFPKMLHRQWAGKQSYLRLSETLGVTWKDMRAVCSKHFGCTLSKSCRTRRPVGLLWAWLEAAENFDSKEAHKAFIPDYERRLQAREAFSLIDESKDWLDAEDGGTGGAEPADPP